MQRDQAITRLPVTYRQALRLVALGRSDEEIARRLGVEPQAVQSLVDLAEAKLARLTATPPPGGTNGGEEDP